MQNVIQFPGTKPVTQASAATKKMTWLHRYLIAYSALVVAFVGAYAYF